MDDADLDGLMQSKGQLVYGDRVLFLYRQYQYFDLKNAEFLKIKYNNYCSVCGKHDDHLQIHHIDKNPMNNTIENLALVCDKCHDKYHPHRKDIINNKK